MKCFCFDITGKEKGIQNLKIFLLKKLMHKNRKIPWTQTEVDLLVDLYKKELKYDDILSRFPKSYKSGFDFENSKTES